MSFPWIDVATTVVAVVSAIWAAFEARQAQQSEREAERLRALEERVSAHKYEVYKPMIEAWADVIGPDRSDRAKLGGPELAAATSDFVRWLSIFGSDEAVIAFRDMLTAGYQVPHISPTIPMRMYAEFVLAARRDLGDTATGLRAVDVLAPTIKDAFDNRNWYEDMSIPLDELFAKYSFAPPWRRSGADMVDDRATFRASLNAQVSATPGSEPQPSQRSRQPSRRPAPGVRPNRPR